jgi:hypothetical protein
VPDLDPNWKRVAQLTRLLGSSGGERRNAFAALERTMQTEGVTWTDLGNAIECSIDGKYTEDEMQQFALAIRKEGVEEGIKIGMARASNGGSSNDAPAPPSPAIMAAYCQERHDQLNDWECKFIDDMHVGGKARRFTLTAKQKNKLQDIYQQLGGT